ncbi:hypothetical protein GQ457_04G030390 [Hibiscus cannabinus]
MSFFGSLWQVGDGLGVYMWMSGQRRLCAPPLTDAATNLTSLCVAGVFWGFGFYGVCLLPLCNKVVLDLRWLRWPLVFRSLWIQAFAGWSALHLVLLFSDLL